MIYFGKTPSSTGLKLAISTEPDMPKHKYKLIFSLAFF